MTGLACYPYVNITFTNCRENVKVKKNCKNDGPSVLSLWPSDPMCLWLGWPYTALLACHEVNIIIIITIIIIIIIIILKIIITIIITNIMITSLERREGSESEVGWNTASWERLLEPQQSRPQVGWCSLLMIILEDDDDENDDKVDNDLANVTRWKMGCQK